MTDRTIRLRPYRSGDDLQDCMAIWRSASEVGHPFLGSDVLDADAVTIRDVYMPSADITVAELDGKVVGFIALLDNFIGGLFVYPGHHRSGAGRALIRNALTRYATLEVEVYEANRDARSFYAATGFVEIGRRETDDHGRPLPLLRLRLG